VCSASNVINPKIVCSKTGSIGPESCVVCIECYQSEDRVQQSSPVGPALWLCRPRVLGPGVFGVAGAELLANLLVGVVPEAGQVIGNLLGTQVGSEQVQEDTDAAVPRFM
jgi:hypothetical protein